MYAVFEGRLPLPPRVRLQLRAPVDGTVSSLAGRPLSTAGERARKACMSSTQSLQSLLSEADSLPVDWRAGEDADVSVQVKTPSWMCSYRLHRRRITEGPRYSHTLHARLAGGLDAATLSEADVPAGCGAAMDTLWDFVYANAFNPPIKLIVPLLKLGFTLDIKELRQRSYTAMRRLMESDDASPTTVISFMTQARSLGLANVEKAAILSLAHRAASLTEAQLRELNPRCMAAIVTASADLDELSTLVANYLRLWCDTASGHGKPSGAGGAGGGPESRARPTAAAAVADDSAEPAHGRKDDEEGDAETHVTRYHVISMISALKNINGEDALFLLGKATEFDVAGELIENLVSVVAGAFMAVDFEEITKLPLQVVRNLLSRDDLYVPNETVVFEAITRYLTRRGGEANARESEEVTLWETCRFPFLPLATLLHATACEGIPTRLVLEGITASMMMQRTEGTREELASYVEEGSHPAPGGVSRLSPRTSYRHQRLPEASEIFAHMEGKRAEDEDSVVQIEKQLVQWIGDACDAPPPSTAAGRDAKFGTSYAPSDASHLRRFVLLYRASRDGWESSTFHRLCDNRGPTLTVVATVSGYAFGGYASQSWTSAGGTSRAPGSFLFTMRCAAGLPATKLPLRKRMDPYAMVMEPDGGPSFGHGPDLQIASEANGSDARSATMFDRSFCAPDGLPPGFNKQTFVTGGDEFWPQEVEVFGVAQLPASTAAQSDMPSR